MKTPIFDFVEKYKKEKCLRLHMPGHKGFGALSVEENDITEIFGADVLYSADGIIKESMENATLLFGSKKTLYSTEGCTLAIRGMLALAMVDAKRKGKSFSVLAGRGAHKSFLTSAALLDFIPQWIDPQEGAGFISAQISPKDLDTYLEQCEEKPTALYITSPDYLGQIADVASLSRICKENDILLLVDNAHGAYLHFLSEPYHPLDLGADMVCDSAHKTLPVLTGGAYLHLAASLSDDLIRQADSILALFASTSPSYLILQSLDLVNRYLADGYKEKLSEFSSALFNLKKKLRSKGFVLTEKEPLKIVIQTKASGYSGTELAEILANKDIVCEFSDPDYLVMMLTPENGFSALDHIEQVFEQISCKAPILNFPPKACRGKIRLSPKEALFSPSVEINVENAVGECLAEAGITCPPAVPIAICGEYITEEHVKAFSYYGIKKVRVVKK